MKKLYFRYGAMMSGKSMNLIAVYTNYLLQGKKALLMKPFIHAEWSETIESRTGQKKGVDLCIMPETNLLELDYSGVSCILVDEAQFLLKKHVDQLRELTLRNVPVICYGLRADFRSELFEGSRRLLEVADSIEEIKTTCWFCERKATMNMKLKEGGKSVSIEKSGEMKYVPACYCCFAKRQKGELLIEKPHLRDEALALTETV